ncbi:MAG: helix-turn-helix transcriptional regulator [Clostridiales bacterium]|nr:helix-turn-helix transcriptional regulator [Clostridiales bacterium]
MTFAEKVLQLRVKLQISQMQLAELLGVAYTTVNRWEMGHYKATKLIMVRFDELCKKYGVKFDEKGTKE